MHVVVITYVVPKFSIASCFFHNRLGDCNCDVVHEVDVGIVAEEDLWMNSHKRAIEAIWTWDESFQSKISGVENVGFLLETIKSIVKKRWRRKVTLSHNW